MVENPGSEIIINAESEHSHGMAESAPCSDVVMMDSEVPSSEGEMLIDDAKDKAITCSELDQHLKAEQRDMHLSLSSKSLAADGREDGKDNMEETPGADNKVFSGSKNICASVDNQQQQAMGKSTDAKGCEDDFVPGNDKSHFAEEKNVDIEIVKTDTLNGTLPCVEHETVDSRSKETVEKNGQMLASEDIMTASQDSGAAKSIGDRKMSMGLPTVCEGSVVMVPAQNISNTVINSIDNKPATDSASLCNYDVHLVSSSTGHIILPDSGHIKDADEQITISLPVPSSVSQQADDCKEQIESNVGTAVEVQKHANGFAIPANDISAPASCQIKDADVQIGSNVESLVEVHDQANEAITSCAVDVVTTAPADSVEASEQIGSSAAHLTELQDYSNDTEMVDAGEVNKQHEEMILDVPMFQSKDDDVQTGSASVSGLREEVNDPGNVSFHKEQDEEKEIVADVGNLQNGDTNEQIGLNIGTTQYIQAEATGTESVSLPHGQDVHEETFTEAGKSMNKEEKNVKHVAPRLGASGKEYHVTYELPPETADGFSISNLVWGKVKSHPWWPGQIFHPSDSSEKAMKYYKKDCYLVAYFGDKSFAWNEESQLKPFRTHFSQVEKQSSSEAFQNAVDCALEEVSRRVELGLACSCIPEETYDKIKFQIVENAGIQKDSSKREGGDEYTNADSFQPDKLVNYVRSLAQLPTCAANRLELTIAKSQLLSFSRLKGFDSLPEFQFYDGLLENDDDTSLPQVNSLPSGSEHVDSGATDDVSCTVRLKGPHRRKHNLKDIVYHRRKEKSFSEIMGESIFSYDEDYDSDEKHDGLLNLPTLGRKRKASSFLDDEPMVPESTRTISLAKVSHTTTPSPRQSFKIGDCIRRVASQLTGSPSTMKSVGDESKQHSGNDFDRSLDIPEDTQNGEMVISTEQTSPEEFLWELNLTAQNPKRGNGFSNSVKFFSEFRDAVVSAQRRRKENSSTGRGVSGRKRKSSLSVGGSPETFGFDDGKDSYWTDRVVQNNSEDKQPARRSRKRKDRQLVTGEPERPTQSTQRRHSRKQYFHGNLEIAAEKSSADEGNHELPTELIMNFSDMSSVPSKADLNKMFRRFGPLKESQTEVDRENSCARVVFRGGLDAKVAYSSAAAFNIFGPGTVNYQLSQIPSISSHSSNLALTNGMEEAA